jgi:HD-like signal output (HDOD) protein
LTPDSNIVPDLETLIGRVSSISTIPDVAAKILEATSNPRSNASDLERLTRYDPGLTARVLKMVNSAYFGLEDPVYDVRKAIVFLGFQRMKDLALSSSVCELFASEQQIGRYTRSGLWAHCVAVAVVSVMVSRRLKHEFVESPFSAGLLHDVGIIMFDQYAHSHFRRMMERPESQKGGLEEAERTVFGFTHCQLAAGVLQTWNFPDVFAEVAAFHHHPSQAENFRELSSVVYLADVMCNYANFGFVETKEIIASEFNFALQTLGLTRADIEVMIADVPAELKKADDFIGLIEE